MKLLHLSSSAALAAALAPAVLAGGGLGTLTSVPGSVRDLSLSTSGALLFCTSEGDVGTISTAGAVVLLADVTTSGIADPLQAVVEDPTGDVAVADSLGHIWRLEASLPPAVQVYADLYIVNDPTDMLVDANGTYVLASRTPTAGVRAVNWISSDGARWAYFLVQHQPVALAADPLGDALLLADAQSGGALRLVDAVDPSHPSAPLETVTPFGFSAAASDGDLVAEADGDLWVIGGGSVWFFDRVLGSATLVATGLGQLTGAAIAASSGGVPSDSGWSIYVAEGANPSTIRELGDVGAPADPIAADVGDVPGKGIQHLFFPALNCYELSSDAAGNLLYGGDNFGANPSVHRIELPALTTSQIAGFADGISDRIEGIEARPDGVLFALTTFGTLHRIQESPLSVTTVFSDPLDQIVRGKGLALSRDGSVYVASYTDWGLGDVLEISPSGVATALAPTAETRGISVDPFTAGLFVTEWNDIGFNGTIGRLDPDTSTVLPIPGLAGMNYSNSGNWGDGDTVVDARGRIYTCSEDDFSIHRYDPATETLVRIASGFLKHPSGLAIARSTPGSGSTTGWSLWVSEFIWLYEIPSVAAPAPTLVDPDAPPVGRTVGWLSSAVGTPRALLPAPNQPGFLIVSTSNGTLERMRLSNGAVTTVAGATQGLSGDLVALAADSQGRIVVAESSGTLYRVDPTAGYTVTVLFADALDELADVRGLTLDGLDRPLVSDRPVGAPNANGGRLWRLDGGALELLAYTARGLRPAIDPLTGDVFVTERGRLSDGAGEILRVDAFLSPAASGHFRADGYTTFAVGERDGALAFDADGNFYVGVGGTGRIEHLERATGARSTIAGNYWQPVGLTLAPGTPATAGPQGTSLFVLDRHVVYEVGVAGLPAPPPSASQPRFGAPADLRTQGALVPGGTVPIVVESPADAGQVYVIVLGFAGKAPGFPLAIFDPLDPRVIPNNYNIFWSFVNVAGFTPSFIGVLDLDGKSAPATGLVVPNDPSLLGLDAFLDLAWFTFVPGAPSDIGAIGGTAQIYFGE